MSDYLEKSAKPFSEKKSFYEGVLNMDEFARNYVLRCFETSNEMAPFVEHYFISRRRPQFDETYVGHDVLSQPVATFFILPEGAFFQGPTTNRRTLVAKESPIYVGAQFKPGGFYPFWHKKVSDLAEKTILAAQIIPEADTLFNKPFLQQDDNTILRTIDSALCAQKPKFDPNINLVNKIISYIEDNSFTTTVTSVAAHFTMSERSLQHLFHVYVGVGVKWAIMRARFLEVTKYIRTQEKPNLTAIAADFGYSDQSHFVHDFKKLVGISPRQYVKSLHG